MTPIEIVAPEKAGFSATRLGRIGDLTRRYVDGGKLAGAVSLVSRRGKVVYFDDYGQRDREAGAEMTLDTLFRLYSMTKPITSVAALMLYEDGHFLLDDPIADYLPAFADVQVCVGMDVTGMRLARPERPPSVRDLMRHTAGLSYGWFQDTPVDQAYRDAKMDQRQYSLTEGVEQLAKLPLVYHPGRAWRYSYATDVLGRLVEVLSGESLDEFLQRHILGPLGMRDTAFQVAPEKVERFAACYTLPNNAQFIADGSTPSPADTTLALMETPATSRFTKPPVFLSGGGGLVGSTADYLRFCQMLLNRGVLDGVRLLGRKTVELMTMNHLPAELIPINISMPDPGAGFGLGVKVLVDQAVSGRLGSPGMYGWGGAATTTFWIDPAEELIGIFMTQFMPSGHYPVTTQFQRTVYQALVD
ncbi:MAG: beta-lactamase family protein [Chloroflexi bacterium]|nr:beta-lactamase family protein [Chloroflexota bacterium]